LQKQVTDMNERMAAFQEKTLLAIAQTQPASHAAMQNITNSNLNTDLLGSIPTSEQSLAPMQDSFFTHDIPQAYSMAPIQASIYTHPNAVNSQAPISTLPRQNMHPQANSAAQSAQPNPGNQGFNNNSRFRSRARQGRGRGQGYSGESYSYGQQDQVPGGYNPHLGVPDFQQMYASYHNSHPQNQSFYATPYNQHFNYQHPPPSHFMTQGYQNQGYQNQGSQHNNRQGNSGHNWPQRSQSPGGGSYVREQPPNQNQPQQNRQNQQTNRPPTPHASPNNQGGNY
jgi:hypothetical protein